MALVTFKAPYTGGPTGFIGLPAGDMRVTVGRSDLAAGTNHINTGLARIQHADVQPINDAPGTGITVNLKLNTAAGTEGDAPGFLTIESASDLDYDIEVWGW